MSSSRGSDDNGKFTIDFTPKAHLAIDLEQQLWLLLHEDEPSQLAGEVARAIEALAVHPYLGRRLQTPRTRKLFKLLLGRTGFFLTYEVLPRRRIVRIVGLIHGSGERAP